MGEGEGTTGECGGELVRKHKGTVWDGGEEWWREWGTAAVWQKINFTDMQALCIDIGVSS